MTLQLTVLGSGTCELRADRSSPGYLLSHGPTSLLLDLGQGTLRRLLQAGQDPAALSAVFMSHHHLDHIGDLPALLFALNYDPALIAAAELKFLGHAQVGRTMEDLSGVFGEWIQSAHGNFAFQEVSPQDERTLGEMSLSFCPAEHIGSSLALRVDCADASLVYLGDSQKTQELIDFAQGASLLIAHCAAPDHKPKKGHIIPREAGELAAAAGVKGLLISHLYRDVDPEQAVASAQAAFSGPVWAARDLMNLAITPQGADVTGE